jgi:hypothetical protein
LRSLPFAATATTEPPLLWDTNITTAAQAV